MDLLLRLFVKNAENTDDAGVRTACGKFAGIVGIVCNLLLFGAKFLIGTLAGAVSVTADAVNNLSDAASSVMTMIGFRLAEKPADEDHPFGHARYEYLAGMLVAVLILFIGFDLAKTSVTKILNPEPTDFSITVVLVLVLSILLKLWLAHFDRKLGKRIRSSVLMAAAADSRNDVISTAAVLLSCLVGMFTNFNPDGFAGLAVALFILYSGLSILKETIDPLLGKAPEPEELHAIREKILTHSHVLGIHDLIVHDYGPGRRFASVHVEMDRNLDVMVGHDIIDDIEREFAVQEGLQLVIHYDPVVTDDATVSETKTQVQELAAALDPRLSIHDFRMVVGPGHTNVIFDLVVPFALSRQTAELKKQLTAAIRQKHSDYFAVIHVDSEAFNQTE